MIYRYIDYYMYIHVVIMHNIYIYTHLCVYKYIYIQQSQILSVKSHLPAFSISRSHDDDETWILVTLVPRGLSCRTSVFECLAGQDNSQSTMELRSSLLSNILSNNLNRTSIFYLDIEYHMSVIRSEKITGYHMCNMSIIDLSILAIIDRYHVYIGRSSVEFATEVALRCPAPFQAMSEFRDSIMALLINQLIWQIYGYIAMANNHWQLYAIIWLIIIEYH